MEQESIGLISTDRYTWDGSRYLREDFANFE